MHHQAPPRRPRASRASGAPILTRVLKRPLRLGAARRRPARRPLHPRARHAVQGARLRRLLAQPAGHPDLRPPPGRVPRRRRARHDRHQGRRRHRRAGPGRDPAAARPALATGQLSEPSHVEISPDKTVAVVALSVKGSGTDAASERSLEVAALRRRPRHGRPAGRRRGRRDRRDRELEGLHRRHDLARADRVRVRAQPRVHPAAGHVPLDRGADQGDRPQPAVGRRRLRHPRPRLPGRPRREAARLQVGRRHRPRGSRCSCS